MVAARQALRQLRQELRLTEQRERSDRALRFFRDAGAAGFHAVQPDECIFVLVHAGRIAELCGMTVSAISHQLRILKQSRLVKYRKSGKSVFYSLDD